MVGGIIHKAAYEQVQPAVAVVIEPDCAGGPARRSQTGLLSHIAECPATVFLIEDGFSLGGDKHVWASIVVEVAYRYSHAERAAAHPGLLSHIAERAIAI